MIKKIFVFVLILLVCIVPLGSSFAFADTSTENVDFTISPFNFVCLSNYNRNTFDCYYVNLLLNLTINIDSTGYLFTNYSATRTLPNVSFDGYRYTDSNSRTIFYDIYTYNLSNFTWNLGVSRMPLIGYSYYNFGPHSVSEWGWSYYMPCLVISNLSSEFTSTSKSFTNIEIGTHSGYNRDILPGNYAVPTIYQNNIYPFESGVGNYFYITYYYILHSDVSGDVPLGITFNFKCPEDYVYPSRVYQISADSSEWDSGYDFGYVDGYRSGASSSGASGFDLGYNSGYSAGRSIGYSEGYTEAIENGASDNTFVGLVSAVIDVPLNVLKGLFDFNVLGVNLLQFFYSIFTVLLLLFIIKTLVR